ncbi:MAG: 6-phosphogluconolactonase [Candidatus Omnitrophota bacterium]|jgi:6-phosphogluconolactonase
MQVKQLIKLILASCLVGCVMGESVNVYFGTYTGKESKGIYVSQLDMATGELSKPKLAAAASNPSFLVVKGDLIVAVSENDPGTVNTYYHAKQQHEWVEQTPRPTGGGAPCHVTLDATGKIAFVANYSGGNVISYRIEDGRQLSPPVSNIQHKGSSVDPGRQKGPHAHAINPHPNNRFVYAADLGLDQVLMYKLDAATGVLTPNDPPFARVAPGSGPRHLSFRPDGKVLYVINEMNRTISVFACNPETGGLKLVQNISTVPEGYDEGGSTAELLVHPNGHFVYGSNRGHDSIAVYEADAESGKLRLVELEKTRGKTPRGFGIDPTGRYLIAANQNSDDAFVFEIHPQTGALEWTGSKIRVPSPVCVAF